MPRGNFGIRTWDLSRSFQTAHPDEEYIIPRYLLWKFCQKFRGNFKSPLIPPLFHLVHLPQRKSLDSNFIFEKTQSDPMYVIRCANSIANPGKNFVKFILSREFARFGVILRGDADNEICQRQPTRTVPFFYKQCK